MLSPISPPICYIHDYKTTPAVIDHRPSEVNYNLRKISLGHLSDHLSKLVENTLGGGVNSKWVTAGKCELESASLEADDRTVDGEMSLSALNLSMVVTHHNISGVLCVLSALEPEVWYRGSSISSQTLRWRCTLRCSEKRRN